MNRLTQVQGRFHALSFDVCRQGSAMAFHFSTPQGIIILTTSTAEFAAKCRGRFDHNGNTLPEIAPAITAEELPAPAERAKSRGGRRPEAVRAEELDLFVKAWLAFHQGKFVSKAEAARAHGLDYDRWTNWMARQREKLAARLAKLRLPVTKPKGSIL